jgi:hypothetical protein
MRNLPAALCALALLAFSWPVVAGVATPHRLSFQGLARDAADQPVVSGDVRVRIYDAPTSGELVYDSGTEFAGAIVTGVFNVLLGGGTSLLLDDTRLYHLELDINGEEVVGDAAGGRQAFWPSGGDLSRPDLVSRLDALEALLFAECAAGQFNLNGNPADGCEFTLDADGIYVDASDPAANDGPGCGRGPVGTGVDNEPCLTIGRGLTEAVSAGRSKVYVANGTYAEAVTLVNGKSLLGGYHSGTWERDLAASATLLRGESASGNHRHAVVGSGITSPTLVEGFVIFGPVVAQPGGNSYAVHLSNSGGLTLSGNVILGGVGGPGTDGPDGTDGPNGVNGGVGGNAIQSPTSSCSSILNRSGGAAGTLLCGGTGVNGGAGGGNRCTPIPNSEFSGFDGVAATGAGGGSGGDAGDDARLQTGQCFPPPNPVSGALGGNGVSGSNGPGGPGGTSPLGTVLSGHWLGATGSSGTAGALGRGGGGGGAGGGSDGIAPEFDVLGGAGGGGGSGACGGAAGGGGIAGGGSFGVFVTGGVAPAITSNVFQRGYGGPGGRGGIGGKGGLGGIGGIGGADSFLCSGAGGRGGDGGNGGHGGGGGGGGGGLSCGIFTSGVGTPNYGANEFLGGGAAAGGVGGLSLGSAGTVGVAGSVTTVTSQ